MHGVLAKSNAQSVAPFFHPRMLCFGNIWPTAMGLVWATATDKLSFFSHCNTPRVWCGFEIIQPVSNPSNGLDGWPTSRITLREVLGVYRFQFRDTDYVWHRHSNS